MPTSSYAAELFEIFKKAAVESFEIKLGDKKAAFALRYRLNKLRQEMRKEGHYMAEIANGVSFLIYKPNENILYCTPADKHYLEDIRAAIGEPSPEAIKAQETLGENPSIKARLSLTGDQALEAFFNSTDKKGE